MTSEEARKSIRDAILKKIEKGEATMRPKSYFIIRAILLLAAIVITASVLFFLMSFILFVLRQSGLLLVPAFGFEGVRTLVTSFPWILIFFVLASIVILELLIRKYAFAYRRPLLYSLIAIVIFTSVGGFIMAQTPIHDEFYERVQSNHLSFAKPLYHGFGLKKLDSVHKGTITTMAENGFQMENYRGEILTVITSDKTRFLLGSALKEGDFILVLGKRGNSTVQAIGVRKIDGKYPRIRFLRGNK